MADASYFISNFTTENNLPEDTKWIAFGCSYAGSLAAWLRLKYPDQVQGAISSSAPLEAKFDNAEYDEVVKRTLDEIYINKNEGNESNCNEELEKGIKALELLELKVQEDLLDQDFDSETLKRNIGLTIRQAIFDVIYTATQYNRKSPNPRFNIQLVCQIILDITIGEPMDRIFELLKNVNQYEENNNTFEGTIGLKNWYWQQCNEFGWLHDENFCQSEFGPKYTRDYITKQIEKTNSNFGGKDLNVSNVVFIHGSIDPWSPYGRTEPMSNEGVEVIVIKGASHCQDLDAKIEDWPEMHSAKTKIKNSLANWISM